MRQSVHWGVVALLLSSPVAAGVAGGPADQSSAALNNPLEPLVRGRITTAISLN
jgi:citrate lyase alpha subunit